MQENILDQHPDADLRVLVVWLPVLATDERFGVADLVVDERAEHFWDGGSLVGRHYGGGGGVAWDVFYTYGPEASWGDPPDETGRPVLVETARLGRALAPYL